MGLDNSLTVECSFEFQVVASKTTTTAARARLLDPEQDMVVPPPSISWHLERLLETGVGSDVTFSVEDGEFHAHTLVVNEREPALLSKTWAEVVKSKKGKKKKEDRKMMIWIEGIKAVVFKALLHFVYMDELPPMDDLVHATGAGKQPSSSSMARLPGDLLEEGMKRRWRKPLERSTCRRPAMEQGMLAPEQCDPRRRRQLHQARPAQP